MQPLRGSKSITPRIPDVPPPIPSLPPPNVPNNPPQIPSLPPPSIPQRGLQNTSLRSSQNLNNLPVVPNIPSPGITQKTSPPNTPSVSNLKSSNSNLNSTPVIPSGEPPAIPQRPLKSGGSVANLVNNFNNSATKQDKPAPKRRPLPAVPTEPKDEITMRADKAIQQLNEQLKKAGKKPLNKKERDWLRDELKSKYLKQTSKGDTPVLPPAPKSEPPPTIKPPIINNSNNISMSNINKRPEIELKNSQNVQMPVQSQQNLIKGPPLQPRTQIQRYQAEISRLRTELAQEKMQKQSSLAMERSNVDLNIKESTQREEILQCQISRLQQQIASKETHISGLENKNRQLEDNLRDTNSKLKEKTDNISIIQSQSKKMAFELEKIRNELQQEKFLRLKAEQSVELLNAQILKVNNLLKNTEKERDQTLSLLSESRKRYEEQIAKIKSTVEAHTKDLTSRLQSEEVKKIAALEKIKILEKELNAQISGRSKDASNLQNSRDLQNERNLLEDKNREMSLEILSLKSKAHDAELARAEIAEHMIMVQIDFNEKRNEFESKIFQLSRKITSLETEKNALNSSKSILENSVAQLKIENEQLNKNILLKNSSSKKNSNINNNAQDQSIKLQYENDILTMKNKIQLLEEQNTNLKSLANDLQESKSRDQQEYQKLNQQIMQIQNKVKQGEEAGRLDEYKKIMDIQLADLRKRLQIEQKEKQDLYEKLSNGISNESLTEEVKKRIELEEKVKNLELEIATLKTTLDEFQSYESYIDKDKGEIDRIMQETEERHKSQLEQLQNKITELEKEIIKHESVASSFENTNPNPQNESIRQRFEEELQEERNRSRNEINEWKQKYIEITDQLKASEEKFSNYQLDFNSKIRAIELDTIKTKEQNSLLQFQVDTLKEVLVRIESESNNTASSSENSENCDFFTSQTFTPTSSIAPSTPFPPPPPPPISTSAPLPPPPPTINKSNSETLGNDRSQLLDQIKGGMQLKSVTKDSSGEDDQNSGDMLQALAKALISRRENLLEGEDDDDEEEDDELWEED